MATATKETKKVLIPPVPQTLQYKTVDDGVTLRLDQKEAVVLRMLVPVIGGHRVSSVRVQTEAIEEALNAAGVLVIDSNEIFGDHGGIYAPHGSGAVLDKLLAEKNNEAEKNIKAIADLKNVYMQVQQNIAKEVLGANNSYVGFDQVINTGFGSNNYG